MTKSDPRLQWPARRAGGAEEEMMVEVRRAFGAEQTSARQERFRNRKLKGINS